MTRSTPPANPLAGLRVLQVLPALKEGGVEQSAVEMAQYLQSKKALPMVASAGGVKLKTLQKSGIPHFKLPLNSKNPFSIIKNAICLARIIHREQVQLVHARSRAPAWSAWLACRWTGAHYITTFHGTYGMGGGVLKRFYNSVMLRGPLVIANSGFIRDHIIETYGVTPSRIVVATRGIEPSVFDPSLFTQIDRKKVRAEWSIPDSAPLLVMVGRLTRWKGQETLLRALAECRDLKWVLALVGADEKGAYEAELRALADELGIADRVRFAGSRTDIPRILAAADLAFSCSTQPEAFGRVAIEAMAMEIPVIATHLGGSLETVLDNKTGWLIAPGAPQALAERIFFALRNPKLLATMGKAARKHVLEHFTVDQCCRAEAEAYLRVLHLQDTE